MLSRFSAGARRRSPGSGEPWPNRRRMWKPAFGSASCSPRIRMPTGPPRASACCPVTKKAGCGRVAATCYWLLSPTTGLSPDPWWTALRARWLARAGTTGWNCWGCCSTAATTWRRPASRRRLRFGTRGIRPSRSAGRGRICYREIPPLPLRFSLPSYPVPAKHLRERPSAPRAGWQMRGCGEAIRRQPRLSLAEYWMREAMGSLPAFGPPPPPLSR